MKFVMWVAGALAFAAVVGGIALFVGLDFGSQMAQAETRAASAVAKQTITFNQEVIDLLGAPLTFGETTVQRSERGILGPSTATLSIEVAGAKTRGKATVTVGKAGPKQPWRTQNGSFFPVAGRPIFLRAAGR